MEKMKQKIPAIGAVLILAGIVVPLFSVGVAVWRLHPDPYLSVFGEFWGMELVLMEGEEVFESPETGEILPVGEAGPELLVDPQFPQRVFTRSRIALRAVHIIAAGLLALIAGVILSVRSARR